MRIAYIGSAHPLRGGLAAFNERLAKELQSSGHEVTLYSFSLQYPGFLFPGKTQYTDEPPPAGLRIRSIINSINPLSWLKAGREIRRTKPDLILLKFWLPFMGPAFGTILRVAQRGGKVPVVCIVDNAIPHEKRPGDAAFTRYFLKAVDAFICMSRDVLADLRTLIQKPALLSPHPLYDNYGDPVPQAEARQKLSLPQGKPVVLFFGFIRDYKGLDLLLKAMADERIRRMGVQVLVAGEFYTDRKPTDELIQSLNLGDALHLHTDFIPEREVRTYFSAADLVVQPYRSATQSGITQIAYHFDKPMVVTNVGGLPEVVPHGKTGLVAEPEPQAIADAIVAFFEQGIPDVARHFAELKQQYSWALFAEKVMEARAEAQQASV